MDTQRQPSPQPTAALPVALFTAAYLLAAATVAASTTNGEFLFYVAVMVVLVAVVACVHWQVKLSLAALWALSFWGLAHMAGGLITIPAHWPVSQQTDAQPVLYNLWLIPGTLRYDQLVHAYGFGATTWVCWQGLRAAVAAQCHLDRSDVKPTIGLLALTAAAGLGFGALNELVEFIATITIPATNVGGYLNTGWDLMANAVGVIVAVLLIGVCHRRQPAPTSPSGS